MADSPQPPKIVVDSDWKSQAQAERERLAKAEAEKKAAAPPASAAGAIPGPGTVGKGAAGTPSVSRAARSPAGAEYETEALPEADFQLLVSTLFTQAYMYLGGFPDPETGRAVVSLEHARLHIDLLEVLEQKTKGNLSTDEASDLTQALSELRLRYVEVTKVVAEMAARRQAGVGGGGLGPSGGGGVAPGGMMFGGGVPGGGGASGSAISGFGPRAR